MKCKSKVEKAYKKGRGSFYSIVGFGSRQNAFNPVTTLKLYKKVVLSSALYGCVTWSNMTKNRLSNHKHILTPLYKSNSESTLAN